MVKNPPAKAGDEGIVGLILGSGRSHGQWSLLGYSLSGRKELDTTEVI